MSKSRHRLIVCLLSTQSWPGEGSDTLCGGNLVLITSKKQFLVITKHERALKIAQYRQGSCKDSYVEYREMLLELYAAFGVGRS